MSIFAWRKFYISIALSLLLFVSPAIAQEEEDASQVSSSPLKLIQEKYDGLPDKGKLAAGAAVGFVGSRVVLNSAMGAIKVAGVAFIT